MRRTNTGRLCGLRSCSGCSSFGHTWPPTLRLRRLSITPTSSADKQKTCASDTATGGSSPEQEERPAWAKDLERRLQAIEQRLNQPRRITPSVIRAVRLAVRADREAELAEQAEAQSDAEAENAEG